MGKKNLRQLYQLIYSNCLLFLLRFDSGEKNKIGKLRTATPCDVTTSTLIQMPYMIKYKVITHD